MIGNIAGQNKRLSDAASRPRDTSSRKENADKTSKDVSSSSEPKKVVSKSQTKVAKSTGKQIKGSFEGLKYSPSAVIQMNGAGYDRKSNHQARYNKSFKSVGKPEFTSSPFALSKNYGIIDNYSSMTTKNSSSDRLGTIVRNNMMFR